MEGLHIHVMDETSSLCKHILVPNDFLFFDDPTVNCGDRHYNPV